MFKASLGFEKREKNKNMEEKRRDVEETAFYFVFVPPPFSIPTCESKPFFWGVVCLLWCPPIPSISLPMSECHSFMTGSHVQDFPQACSRD